MGAILNLTVSPVANSSSITDNTSKIRIKLIVTTNSGTWNHNSYGSGGTSGWIKIDNTQVANLNGSKVDYNTTTTIYDKEHTIKHESDGSKKVKVDAYFNVNTSGTANMTKDLTQSIDLTKIPRASTITVPTSAYIEDTCNITIAKSVKTYYSSIKFVFNGVTRWVTSEGSVATYESKFRKSSTATTETVAFKIPAAFYANYESGDATVTCYTYESSTSTQSLGTYEAKIKILRDVHRIAPVFTVGDIQEKDTTVDNENGNNKSFFQNASNVYFAVYITPQYGATISQVKINGTTASSGTDESGKTFYCSTIYNIPSKNISVYAKDSRGGERTTTYDITSFTNLVDAYAAYMAPSISSVNFVRNNATSNSGVMYISGQCYTGTIGDNSNVLTLEYTVDNGSKKTIKSNSGSSGNGMFTSFKANGYSIRIPISNVDYTQEHTVHLKLYDRLKNANAALTVERTETIGLGVPVFDWDKDDFAFHVPVSMGGNKISDIAEPTLDNDAVSLKYFKENTIHKSTLTDTDSDVLNQISTQGPFTVFDKTEWPMIRLRRTPASETIGAIQAEKHVANMIDEDQDYYRIRLMQSFPGRQIENNYFESYCLPPCYGLDGDKKYDILTSKQTVTIPQGGTGATSANGARSELGAVSIETKSATIEGSDDSNYYNDKTFTFSNDVKMVTVTAIKDNYCASGTWTSHNNGKINRFYHLADKETTWDTKVTISKKDVTVTRMGLDSIKYVVSAITA